MPGEQGMKMSPHAAMGEHKSNPQSARNGPETGSQTLDLPFYSRRGEYAASPVTRSV
jgi:hypothetical protein